MASLLGATRSSGTTSTPRVGRGAAVIPVTPWIAKWAKDEGLDKKAAVARMGATGLIGAYNKAADDQATWLNRRYKQHVAGRAPVQWTRARLGGVSSALGWVDTFAGVPLRHSAGNPKFVGMAIPMLKEEVDNWNHILGDPKGWWDQASVLDKAGLIATFVPGGLLGKGGLKGGKAINKAYKHSDDAKKAPTPSKQHSKNDVSPDSSSEPGGSKKHGDSDSPRRESGADTAPGGGVDKPDGSHSGRNSGRDGAGSTSGDDGGVADKGNGSGNPRAGSAPDGPASKSDSDGPQAGQSDSPREGTDAGHGHDGADPESAKRDASDPEHGSGNHVDLDELPPWHSVDPVPTTGPEARIYDPNFDRWAGKSQQEFYDEWYDAEAGAWKYPSKENGAKYDDGFAETPRPNTLKVGDTIDRLGGSDGNFAAPDGTPFGERALPPSDVGREYHRYRVVKPLPETVTEGRIAGWFDQPGGGTQYKFDKDIDWYLENEYLEPA